MRFSQTHEWIEEQGSIAVIGITEHAQRELGDIVFVELPKIGRNLKAGEEAAVLESTKAAADVYSPLTGTVLEVNERLQEEPELVNCASQKEGWLFKLRIEEPLELEALLEEKEYLAQFG